MHLGDTVRHLTTGIHGEITEMSDTHVQVTYPTDNGPEIMLYLHGSIIGKSGYLQHAEIVECPHLTADVIVIVDATYDEAVAFNTGVMESALRTVMDIARHHRYPSTPAPAWKLLEGYAQIMDTITACVSTLRPVPSSTATTGADYILRNASADRSDDNNKS